MTPEDRSTYEFRGEVIDRLARIETLMAALRDDLDGLTKHRSDHDDRLTALEWKSKLLTIGLVVVSGLAGKEHFLPTLVHLLT